MILIVLGAVFGLFTLLILRRLARKRQVDDMLARPYRYAIETRGSRWIGRGGF